MKQKKLLIALGLVALLAIAAVIIYMRWRGSDPSKQEIISDQRQLINVLPIEERPFVALFPHVSNKLITLYVVNDHNASKLALEIEYLSGNALKGGRTSVPDDATFPYTKGFLLGSCSAGGKCSFDTDITTGTIKTALIQKGESHILRSNYTFVGQTRSATSDQKIAFTPAGRFQGDVIVGGSHGFIGQLEAEAAMEPVVLTSSVGDEIEGVLSLRVSDASSILFWDGKAFSPIEAVQTDTGWDISLEHAPQAIASSIIRDDLKGAEEDVTLYLLGPFIAIK
jgi:hypothetical protein